MQRQLQQLESGQTEDPPKQLHAQHQPLPSVSPTATPHTSPPKGLAATAAPATAAISSPPAVLPPVEAPKMNAALMPAARPRSDVQKTASTAAAPALAALMAAQKQPPRPVRGVGKSCAHCN